MPGRAPQRRSREDAGGRGRLRQDFRGGPGTRSDRGMVSGWSRCSPSLGEKRGGSGSPPPSQRARGCFTDGVEFVSALSRIESPMPRRFSGSSAVPECSELPRTGAALERQYAAALERAQGRDPGFTSVEFAARSTALPGNPGVGIREGMPTQSVDSPRVLGGYAVSNGSRKRRR